MFKPEAPEGQQIRALVDITVEGGIVYSGEIYSFSPEADEHADRELTLIEPITKRIPASAPSRRGLSLRTPPPPDDPQEQLLDASLFGISAREIKHIAVRWERVPPIPGQ